MAILLVIMLATLLTNLLAILSAIPLPISGCFVGNIVSYCTGYYAGYCVGCYVGYCVGYFLTIVCSILFAIRLTILLAILLTILLAISLTITIRKLFLRTSLVMDRERPLCSHGVFISESLWFLRAVAKNQEPLKTAMMLIAMWNSCPHRCKLRCSFLQGLSPHYLLKTNLNMHILRRKSGEHYPFSCHIQAMYITLYINNHAVVKRLKFRKMLKKLEREASRKTAREVIAHDNA